MTNHKKLQSTLEIFHDKQRIVGMSAAIIQKDGIYWTGVSGMSSKNVPVDVDMCFGIGSITKIFVATLILKYNELELLSLNDALGKWLDNIAFVDSKITVRQLLNHTSGLYNYMAHPDYVSSLYAHPDSMWTAKSLLSSFMKEPINKPGKQWEYSAANYLLLGMIIERISGNPVHVEIRTKILEQLNLEKTYMYPQESYNTERMAHLWMDIDSSDNLVDLNQLLNPPPLVGLFSSVGSAGAMHSTAYETAKFLSALFEHQMLSKKSLDKMTEFVRVDANVLYGLGLMQEEFEGVSFFGHSGGIGYSSIAIYIPKERVSIAVLCNSECDPRPIAIALYKIVNSTVIESEN